MENEFYPVEIFNGEPIAGGSSLFTSQNRAIRYGDGLFETITVRNGRICFLNDHWERLLTGMNILQIPQINNFDKYKLEGSIHYLLEKNNLKNARTRLVIYRDAPGFYMPVNNHGSWHLSVTGSLNEKFSINESGLSIALFRDDYKSTGLFSNLKTLNSLLYVMAGIESNKKHVDEMLILNSNGNIIESVTSNIFTRNENVISTPPLSDGCLAGIMRKHLISLLRNKDYRVEERYLTENDLQVAQEFYLTNVVHGVRWVAAFEGKQYQNALSTKIIDWLNEELRV